VLSERILKETGIPGTTSIVALEFVLRATRASGIGLVSLYTEKYQRKMIVALEKRKMYCLKCITSGGASGLRQHSIGSLGPGQQADSRTGFVVVRHAAEGHVTGDRK